MTKLNVFVQGVPFILATTVEAAWQRSKSSYCSAACDRCWPGIILVFFLDDFGFVYLIDNYKIIYTVKRQPDKIYMILQYL